MLVAFFESIKYTGHLVPIAFLRIYMGYYFLLSAIERYEGDYLTQPRLAGVISEWLPTSMAPGWYQSFLEGVVVPNWQIFAYLITYCEFLIGVSFLVGFFVRPVAILGILLTMNFMFNTAPLGIELNKAFLAMFVAMGWIGAGRCLGMDYFFFKRKRGIWW